MKIKKKKRNMMIYNQNGTLNNAKLPQNEKKKGDCRCGYIPTLFIECAKVPQYSTLDVETLITALSFLISAVGNHQLVHRMQQSR